MIRSRIVVVLVLLGLLVPYQLAAAAPGRSQDAGSMIPELNLGGFGGGPNPQSNFNPFSPNALAGKDYLFEKLYIINGYNCEQVPWLATGYEWTDPKTLVFTVREGVVWSDGTPFTADDVAFTYNLLKEFPALDLPGATPLLAGAEAAHPTVTLTFTEQAYQVFNKIVDVFIVPKHLWEGVEDPITFTNDQPVGSGPFLFDRFNGQQLTMVRNPDYWQAETVRVEKLVYKGSAGGQVDQLKLAEGEYDWNAMFIPEIEQTYVSKDPEVNKYWFPSGSPISLYLNHTKEPFNDLEFRRGLAHAINRQEIVDKAQFGYVQVASQTGLVQPNQDAFLAPDLPNGGYVPYDPAQAEQILADAGYTKDGDGRLLGKDSEPIEFSFIVENGWNDWVQAAQIIQENLKAVGITMDVQTLTPEIVDADRRAGNFDATFGVHGGSCSMYDNFYAPLASASTKPVGEQVITGGNSSRWQDPETDALIEQLRNTDPADTEAMKPILHELQKIMVNEYPVIPLWYGAIWFQYRTEKAVGWPSAEDPYASPNNGLLIITRLTPVEG